MPITRSDSVKVRPAQMTTGSTTTRIESNDFTTNAFKALQSADERRVLDIVDNLRRSGLNGDIELPQLVVCGDQSSGKSSVLEAITEIPFPRRENLCTRFATEIVLRRSTESTISISITPDKSCTDQERNELRDFKAQPRDFKDLPDVIEKAAHAMGIVKPAGTGSQTTKSAFSRHVLSVEICGPDRPQLTLVDLPGLIHTTGKDQSSNDRNLVFKLVDEYMRNPRTIILAIITSKNDWQNQVILQDCRKIDPQGRRTLGIITKPDVLASSDVKNWISLAKNEHIFFERGWHVLKNRSPDEMNSSFAERNQSEKRWFRTSPFKSALSEKYLGIEALRRRLSTLLLDHLIEELPLVKEEIHEKLKTTRDELEKLGEKRTTVTDQRNVLLKMSLQIQNILNAAVIGYYDNPFFKSPDMDASVDTGENIRRFRAVVQYQNKQFADAMRRQGHKYTIACGLGDDDVEMTEAAQAQTELASMDKKDFGSFLPKPKALTREEAVTWVLKVLERSRGNELPGNFNPALIGQLFKDQSSPWEEIAMRHIYRVFDASNVFIKKLLAECAPVDFRKQLYQLSVKKSLSDAVKAGEDELKKLVNDNERPPSTFNPYFTSNLQKQRQRKHYQIAQNAVKQAEVIPYAGGTRQIDPLKIEKAFADSIEQNTDKFSAEEALDNQRAYYKDERQYFINAVVKTVIERHLVDPLPRIILSPVIITQMTEREIRAIAAEKKETMQYRNHLESRRAMLEEGLNTFRDAMSGFKD